MYPGENQRDIFGSGRIHSIMARPCFGVIHESVIRDDGGEAASCKKCAHILINEVGWEKAMRFGALNKTTAIKED